MGEVELKCAVYGDGTVFPVKIPRDAKVNALQEAIFSKKRFDEHHQYTFDASTLALYVARKDGQWLKRDATLERVLKRGRQAAHGYDAYVKMISNWILGDDYLGAEFEPGQKEIHVLVDLPHILPPRITRVIGPTQTTRVWRVCGTVPHAQCAKEVHGLLYRLAGLHLGYYYDLDHRAVVWEGDTFLYLHVLFKSEQNALHFEHDVKVQMMMLGSPLIGQEITTRADRVGGSSTSHLQRIFYTDYDRRVTGSPQDTVLSTSLSPSVSIVDPSTDEFTFQRIEDERFFVPYGRAESCRLVPRTQCNAEYDHDPNNRLALSREMHDFYDGVNCEVPLLNIYPGTVEETPSVGNRYKVEIFIKVLDAQCKYRVFRRLDASATPTEDPLVMKMAVRVANPQTFCLCLKWKYEHNSKSWREFLAMTPAVP